MIGALIKLRSEGETYNGLVTKYYIGYDCDEIVSILLRVIWNDGDVTHEEIHTQDNGCGDLSFLHHKEWLSCRAYLWLMIDIAEQFNSTNDI